MVGERNEPPIVGIIGLGHVGRALAGALEPVARVVTFDQAIDTTYPDAELAECRFVAVCVDTPTAADGRCDTSNVRAAVRRVPNGLVWVRSTVPPGTIDALVAETGKAICLSPEYFGQHAHVPAIWSAAPADVPFLIVGGEPAHRSRLLDQLVVLFGAEKHYLQCTAREAELVKYMENAFLATKVTFVNEFKRICDAFGADWHTVREGWLLDPRVGRSHSAVFDPPGYGGPCLPKDLDAIIHACSSVGLEPRLLQAVQDANAHFRSEAEPGPRAPGEDDGATGDRAST